MENEKPVAKIADFGAAEENSSPEDMRNDTIALRKIFVNLVQSMNRPIPQWATELLNAMPQTLLDGKDSNLSALILTVEQKTGKLRYDPIQHIQKALKNKLDKPWSNNEELLDFIKTKLNAINHTLDPKLTSNDLLKNLCDKEGFLIPEIVDDRNQLSKIFLEQSNNRVKP